MQPGRRRNAAQNAAQHGLVAAPGPVLGKITNACPHGVEHHVARQLQQVGFALHDDGFESTLKDVTDPAVGAVVRTRR